RRFETHCPGVLISQTAYPEPCLILLEHSVDGNFDGLAKGSAPSGIGDPEDRIGRRTRVRVAAQISQVDKAHRRHASGLDPFEHWAEVRSAAALGLKHHGLRWPEFLRSIDGCIAIDNVNCCRLCLVGD